MIFGDFWRFLAVFRWQIPNRGPHEKWTNGQDIKAVPRHKEINEFTALGIIRFAGKNPPEPKEKR